LFEAVRANLRGGGHSLTAACLSCMSYRTRVGHRESLAS